jgi:ribosomal protein S18 acetylase RimI-like enzyme
MADLEEIWRLQHRFWGDRDLRALHHPLLVHEFGETALVARGESGVVAGYLFGMLTPSGVAYAHLAAVRDDHRRAGIGRQLYARLEEIARHRRAHALKAFTRPSNAASIRFHTSLGFTASEVPDYAGRGEARVVFWRELG